MTDRSVQYADEFICGVLPDGAETSLWREAGGDVGLQKDAVAAGD